MYFCSMLEVLEMEYLNKCHSGCYGNRQAVLPSCSMYLKSASKKSRLPGSSDKLYWLENDYWKNEGH